MEKFFGEYLDYASDPETVNEFFEDYIHHLKSLDVDGLDLNFESIADRLFAS